MHDPALFFTYPYLFNVRFGDTRRTLAHGQKNFPKFLPAFPAYRNRNNGYKGIKFVALHEMRLALAKSRHLTKLYYRPLSLSRGKSLESESAPVRLGNSRKTAQIPKRLS